MKELLQRVTALSEQVFTEWINLVESTPVKISDPLYAAYQNLDSVRVELTRLEHGKEKENKE